MRRLTPTLLNARWMHDETVLHFLAIEDYTDESWLREIGYAPIREGAGRRGSADRRLGLSDRRGSRG